MSRFRLPKSVISIAAATTLLALSACTGAPGSDTSAAATDSGYETVTLTNCGMELTFDAPPTATVTLNQAATEVMLSLGLHENMAGTAYLDDEVSPKWADEYNSIPVLSDAYPDKETFLSASPDFAYSSFSSAFTDKSVGTREELAEADIPSYISSFYCPEPSDVPDTTMENAWQEVRDIGTIFGVSDRAEELIDEQKTKLAELEAEKAGEGLSVLWYDSGTETPFVGAGDGGPQIILDTIGARNIFGDLEGNWKDGSWERVIEENPDVIVFAEASWSTVDEKIDYLENDPVLSQLDAVKNKAYVTIPFSESNAGVRLVDGAENVSTQLTKLPK